jgi:hypothetical protein
MSVAFEQKRCAESANAAADNQNPHDDEKILAR